MIILSFIGIGLCLVAYGSFRSRFLRSLALILILPHMVTTLAYFGSSEGLHVSRFMMLLFALLGNTLLWIHFMLTTDERIN